MKNVGMLSIDNLFKYHCAIQVYKCINGISPGYLCNMFTLCGENHGYGLRNVGIDVRPPLPHLETAKRSFRYTGAHVWNSVPQNIRQSATLSIFKRSFKQYLLNM